MAIIATQKVLTLDYWKFADKLEVGDYVFNKDGKIVTITKIHKYFSEECYEVKFNDCLTMCGDKHLGFLLETAMYRQKANLYKGYHKFKSKLWFTKLENLIGLPLRTKRNRNEYSVPVIQPLRLPMQMHPVPAFIFSFWYFSKAMIPAKILKEEIHQKFKDHGYKVTVINNHSGKIKVEPSIESQLAPYIPTKIPENYLMGSVEERIEFLRGVIYAYPGNYRIYLDRFIVPMPDNSTAIRMQNLIESLGILCYYETTKRGDKHLSFKTNIRLIPWQKPAVTKVHYTRRFIKEIKPIQSQMCVHIETSEEDNSLVVGEGYIATC